MLLVHLVTRVSVASVKYTHEMPRKVFQAANLSGYGLYITGNITLVLNK